MKAWIKEPNEEVRLDDIDNELVDMQRTVGGYIECYALSESETVVCNEDGMLLNLPRNCRIDNSFFYGTIFICGTDGDEFTNTQITEDEIARIIKDWR